MGLFNGVKLMENREKTERNVRDKQQTEATFYVEDLQVLEREILTLYCIKQIQTVAYFGQKDMEDQGMTKVFT